MAHIGAFSLLHEGGIIGIREMCAAAGRRIESKCTD